MKAPKSPATPKPLAKPQPVQGQDPHPSRLQGFVLFCQGFDPGMIADLLCVCRATVTNWRLRDDWERWKAELSATTIIAELPPWVPYVLIQLRNMRREVKQLRRELRGKSPLEELEEETPPDEAF